MPYAIAALIVLAILFALKSKGSKQPRASKPAWQFDKWSKGATLHPDGSGCWFDFPGQSAGNVGYLQKRGAALTPRQTVRVRFAVTGGGFVPVDPQAGTVALVSLVIQRRGDNWQADARTKSYRWYSAQTVELAAGEFELTVPLEVSAWGDVFGGQDAGEFAATLADVDNIAIAFGSAGGRGHGVYGAGRFTLLELTT